MLNKRTYTNYQTKITAENLNEIQDAIIDLQEHGGGGGGGTWGSITGNLEDQTDLAEVLSEQSSQIALHNDELSYLNGNQIIENGNFTSTAGWAPKASTLTASNNELLVTAISASDNQGIARRNINSVLQHKYYGSVEVKPSAGVNVGFSLNYDAASSDTISRKDIEALAWTKLDGVAYFTNSKGGITVCTTSSGRLPAGGTLVLRNLYIVDLTDKFGKGNEPSLGKCRLLFKSYSDYNPKGKVKVVDEKVLNAEKAVYDNSFNFIAYSSVTGLLETHKINSKEHFNAVSDVPEFTTLKADMRLTSDGKIILCHDAGFTFDGDGYITTYDSSNKTLIRNLTYAECMALRYSGGDHEHVCDLDYFIKVCKQKEKNAYITIRNEYQQNTIDAYMEILRKYDFVSRTIVNNYPANDTTCSLIRNADSTIAISYTTDIGTGLTTSTVNKCIMLGNCILTGNGVSNDASVLNSSADAIAYAKKHNIRVYASILSADISGDLLDYGITGGQISVLPVAKKVVDIFSLTGSIRTESSSNQDLNTVTEFFHIASGTAPNRPSGRAGGYVITFYWKSGRILQFFIQASLGDSGVYVRKRYDSTWSDWSAIGT